MKKQWMQMASLVLNCALILLVFWQGARLEDLERQTDDGLEDLEQRLDMGLEEAKKQEAESAPTVRFAQVRVDTASRMLTMDVTVEGAEGAELPADLGFCSPGEPYRLSWTQVHLERQADGRTLSQTVTIPLDLEAGLELRQLDDTVLLRLDSMVSLLPLQLSDGGAAWHYSSQAEMFYQCDWYASFQDPSGEEAKARNGAFHVYRNGKRVFTGQETEEWYVLEADGERVDAMRFDCAPGDHMRLTYTCEDAFGMHYEFPIREQVALAWDDMRDCPLSHIPTVTWPE